MEKRKECRKSVKAAYTRGWIKDARKFLILPDHLKPSSYWTKKMVLADAKKYKSPSNWKKNCIGSYRKCIAQGWIVEAKKFLVNTAPIPLTKKEVFKEALKYNSRNDFKNKARRHHQKASKYGWMKKCCKHMKRTIIWDEKTILREFRKCKSRSELWDKITPGIKAARRLGIYDKAIAHFPPKKTKIPKLPKSLKPHPRFKYKYLTNDELIILATKSIGQAKTKNEYRNQNRSIYEAIKSRKLFVKFSERFENGTKLDALKRTIWNKETIYAEALKYNKKSNFRELSSGAYSAASKLKIMDEVCIHMQQGVQCKYSKEEILAEALKYQTKEEFRENSRKIYSAACERGLYREATSHMKNIKRNLEELEYPKFDEIFDNHFIIYDTSRNKKLFGFTPDRIIEKNGKFYIIEIKKDTNNKDCSKQIAKYITYGQNKFKSQFSGVFLCSPNGGYKNSDSFIELFKKLKKRSKNNK